MTSGYIVTVPRTPLVELVDAPRLVRWTMAYADARRGWRRPIRQAAKAAFRLVHQRLGIPATGRLRLGGPDSPRTFRADMSNTAYSKVLLAERTNGFEPEMAALLRQLAGRLGPVFDVGANCGFFAARLLTTPAFRGHVHAFEVVPSTYRALARMRAECRFEDRMTCHAFGLSDTDATVFVEMGVHSSLARISERGAVAAEVRTVDSLDLPAPDLVKIDVEGHETRVLDGARRTLQSARPIVVFESWDRPQDPTGMVSPFARLGGLGYRFFALRAQVTQAGQTRLHLEPMTPAERLEVREQMNILAVPEDRLTILNQAFEPLPA